jgi:hypothetical protein
MALVWVPQTSMNVTRRGSFSASRTILLASPFTSSGS